MNEVREISSRSRAELDLPPEVEEALKDVQAEIAGAYRQAFVELMNALKQQTSALERIQTTLNILVQHVAPQLEGKEKLPVAFRVTEPGVESDLASALVVADPIGAGYTLSQADLARALGVPQTDISVLSRAFRLADDGKFAVRVRKGASREMVNYHSRAIERIRKLVFDPPRSLGKTELRAVERARRRLSHTGV